MRKKRTWIVRFVQDSSVSESDMNRALADARKALGGMGFSVDGWCRQIADWKLCLEFVVSGISAERLEEIVALHLPLGDFKVERILRVSS